MGKFSGEFEHKIDAKGRIFVPRRVLEEIDDPAERGHFHVVVSDEGCLDVYTESGYDRFVREALASQKTRKGARLVQRRLGANSRRVSLDAQGRITLPEELRKKIRMENDAMIVGSIDYFEIWDRRTYQQEALPAAEQYYEEESEQFPSSAFGGGGKQE